MAQCRRAYAWTITYDDPLECGEHVAGVWELLQRWQAQWPRVYSSVWVNGGAFGLIQCGVVVTRRDQWECRRKAVRLAKALAGTSGKGVYELLGFEPAKLDPHTHRGERRFLAPKYQEPPDGAEEPASHPGQPSSADA